MAMELMPLGYYGDSDSDKQKNLAIIPAAGLGTRVGSPAAKELLPHPMGKKTFLETTLDLCDQFDLHPLVISRNNKQALNTKLVSLQKQRNLSFLILPPTLEWTYTLHQSRAYFGKKNILLLPDAVFDPHHIIKELLADLDSYQLSFASFSVENPQKWGCLSIQDNNFYFCEKPLLSAPRLMAWGLIAFTDQSGGEFFNHYKETSFDHQWRPIYLSIKVRNLHQFIDLQR
jgi:dTDP-glucose pyrophosphorylase